MKRVLFLSGKGGTGKTTLAGAFAVLWGQSVLADCDVDAANLHLLFAQTVRANGAYEGSKLAVLDRSRCSNCGLCVETCRFGAIHTSQAGITLDPYACEGCGVCAYVCPEDAMSLETRISGRWLTADTPYGPLASGELDPGEETSGKLVSLVRRKADELAADAGVARLVIDGSPGIGCPVIASASGVDAVVLVTEPSLSGLHDLKRVLGVVRYFRLPAFLVINKADLSDEITQRIREFAEEQAVPMLGEIPFDPGVTAAMVAGRSIAETEGPAADAVRRILERFSKEIHDH